jgi:hypothetical protein
MLGRARIHVQKSAPRDPLIDMLPPPAPSPRNEQSQGAGAQVWRQSRTCGRTSPPSLPIAQAHVVCSLGGGGTAPHVAMMSTMRPGTGDAATASAPGRGGGAEGERQ